MAQGRGACKSRPSIIDAPGPLATASRTVAEVALSALVAFCPLALGGVPLWTLWPLVASSAVASAAACVSAAARGHRLRLPFLGAFLAVSAGACLLQLIPLPPALLRWVSPSSGELYDFALAPLGLTHARPVTLDAAATWRELAKHLAYLGAFFTAAELGRSRRARRRLARVLAGTGAFIALAGFGHRLVGAGKLFGFYAYVHGPPPLQTPFANPNHLAGFLLLSSTVALALALSAAGRPETWIWGLAYAVSGGALLLSLSRGGIGCFALTQGAFVVGSAWIRRRSSETVRSPGLRRLVWGAVAVLSVGAVGFAIASDDILEELASANSVEKLSHSKVELWPMMWRAAWGSGERTGFGRSGMGRGAFLTGFTRFQEREMEETFTHPENEVFQLVDEFGLPVAAALLAILGAGFWRLFGRLRRREPSSLDLALWVGAGGLLLHNLVDFNLEFSGCAVAFWGVLGLLSRPEAEREAAPETARARSGRLAWVLTLAGAGLALVALGTGRGTVEGDEAALAEAMKSGSGAAVEQAARPLIDRHPADYVLYNAVAASYLAQRPPRPREALAFLNRALYLRPIDDHAHALAAAALLSLGHRSQAFLEYRLAYQASFIAWRWTILDAAAQRARTAEELRAAVPDRPDALAEAMERAAAHGKVTLARELADAALQDHGEEKESVPLWVASAGIRRAQGDVPGALEQLSRAEKLSPADLGLALTKADILVAGGQAEGAVGVLEPLLPAHPSSFELAMAIGRAQLAAGRPRRAIEAYERLRPFVSSNDARTQLLMAEAEAYARDGRTVKQLEAYQAASRLLPASADLHYRSAQVLEAMGRAGDALEEVRSGLRLEGPQAAPDKKAWAAALEAKRKRP